MTFRVPMSMLMLISAFSLISPTTAFCPSWPTMAKLRMTSSSRKVRLVKRLSVFSVPRRRTSVSDIAFHMLEGLAELTQSDVIVLTSMGEEVAIDAKEAPRS